MQWHALVRLDREHRLRHRGAVSRNGVSPQDIDTLDQGNTRETVGALRIGHHATNQLIGVCAITVNPDHGVSRHMAL